MRKEAKRRNMALGTEEEVDMRERLRDDPTGVEARVIMAVYRPEYKSGTLSTGKGGGIVKVSVLWGQRLNTILTV